ncbi:MAG: PKD domain-containing protein [Bacteroidetes bacterium]|nr:PKD domain-containing protein [Bacteroidota bacterium]
MKQLYKKFMITVLLLVSVQFAFSQTDFIPVKGLASGRSGFALWNANGQGPESQATGHVLPTAATPVGQAHFYMSTRDYDNIDLQSQFGMTGNGSFSGFTGLWSTMMSIGYNVSDIHVGFELFCLGDDIENEDWWWDSPSIEVRKYQGNINFYIGSELILTKWDADFLLTIDYGDPLNPNDDYCYAETPFFIPSNVSYNASTNAQTIATSFVNDFGQNGIRLVIDDLYPAPVFNFVGSGRTGIYMEFQDASIEKGDQAACNLDEYFDVYAMDCQRYQFSASTYGATNPQFVWTIDGVDYPDTNYFSMSFAPGDHDVEIYMEDLAITGCVYHDSTVITVLDSIGGNFSVDVTDNHLEVDAMGITGGSGDFNYTWDFGNGYNVSNLEYVEVAYIDTGNYSVCLTVTDQENYYCTYYVCNTAEILTTDGCNLSTYFFDNTSSCTLTRNFSAYYQSVGGMVNIFWDMGDGNTYQDTADVEHTFAVPGTYIVSVTVEDPLDPSCTAYYEEEVIVDNSFQVNLSYTIDHNTVLFNAGLSGVAPGANMDWNFGDGDYEYGQMTQISHEYGDTGIYNACLYVSDYTSGCSEQQCLNIEITEMDYCMAYADFWFDVDTTGYVFSFFSNSSQSNQHYWYFDDGATSTEMNPVHTCNADGFYDVFLSVFDTLADCYDEIEIQIQVGTTDCYADFYYYPSPTSNSVTFVCSSGSDASLYYWSFDDGTFSHQKNPVHIFPDGGYYSVCLVVSDSLGACIDEYCDYVAVGDLNCQASFGLYVDSLNNTVHFQNNSVGQNLLYYWEFGDGAYSAAVNPTHNYGHPGYFYAGIYIEDTVDGCWGYYEDIVMIGDVSMDCEADFSYISNETSNEVIFHNTSGNLASLSVKWNFGDGTSSTVQNPVHTFASGGYYDVCLTIQNAATGCYNIYCDNVIAGDPDADCYAGFFYITDTTKVKFVNASSVNITDYAWDFGDGATSALKSPVHNYGTPDFYIAFLEVENSTTGCFDYYFDYVNAGAGDQGLQAAFGYIVDSTSKSNQYPVDFKGAAFGDPAVISWDFGDGSTDSSTLKPTHIYDSAGTYNVCFSISDPITGASDSYCQDVEVNEIMSVFELPEFELMTMKIFPNPATTELSVQISLDQVSDVNIEVIDIAGRVLFATSTDFGGATDGVVRINIENLESGTYFVRAENRSHTKTLRFVIGR